MHSGSPFPVSSRGEEKTGKGEGRWIRTWKGMEINKGKGTGHFKGKEGMREKKVEKGEGKVKE